MNKNENITYQCLWDTALSILKGKFIALTVPLEKEKKFQISNLSFHLKNIKKRAK